MTTASWAKKRVSPAEAAGMVKSRQRVGMGWSPGDPQTLQEALLERREELHDVRLGPLNGEANLVEEFCSERSLGHFDVWIVYAFAYHRPALAERTIDWAPPMLGLFPRMGQNGRSDVNASDIYMVRLSPPDANGYCSFGTAIWQNKYALLHSKTVIAEIDDTYIRPCGDGYVHESEIDYWVESAHPGARAEVAMASPDDAEVADVIGAFASTLIHDGDTIQIGSGSASAALYDHLRSKNDLGLHTEVAEEAAIDLVESGVITNRYKNIDTGITVASWYRGKRNIIERIDNNPKYQVRDVSYVDNPRVCAQIDNFVAINAALAVDLGGQITAESFGYRLYTGPGGQPELMTGALLSDGGRNMICLPSTAVNGSKSRIVMGHEEGTAITTPRHFVDYVITEYGIAELFGQTLRQRAANLISISHPAHRDQLSEAAVKLYGPLPAPIS